MITQAERAISGDYISSAVINVIEVTGKNINQQANFIWSTNAFCWSSCQSMSDDDVVFLDHMTYQSRMGQAFSE